LKVYTRVDSIPARGGSVKRVDRRERISRGCGFIVGIYIVYCRYNIYKRDNRRIGGSYRDKVIIPRIECGLAPIFRV
jgi:hypothetical protein